MKTCKDCVYNDCGLCDKKGLLVEDDDSCESHKEKENWKEALLRTFLAGH